jgi:NADH-quinone oxidoreductase subunit L
MGASVGLALISIFIAYKLYYGRTNPLPGKLLERFKGVHKVVYNKYYVDEMYHKTAVRGFMGFSRISAWIDTHIVDGIVNGVGAVTRGFAYLDGAIDAYIVDGMVNLVGGIVRKAGAQVRRLQTGRLPSYLAGLVIGAILLVLLTRFLLDAYS